MNDEARTPHDDPLREIAQNPAAYAAYLESIELTLLDIGRNLETLQHHQRIYLRGTHLEGDRWYHARLRAVPVEKTLESVLRNLKSVTAGLEKSAFKRKEFTDTVNTLPTKRKERELARRQKKNPQLTAPPQAPQGQSQQEAQTGKSGYTNPTSLYDLNRNRESA